MECFICYSDITENQETIKCSCIQCAKIFHLDCFQRWKRNKCPYCFTPINTPRISNFSQDVQNVELDNSVTYTGAAPVIVRRTSHPLLHIRFDLPPLEEIISQYAYGGNAYEANALGYAMLQQEQPSFRLDRLYGGELTFSELPDISAAELLEAFQEYQARL